MSYITQIVETIEAMFQILAEHKIDIEFEEREYLVAYHRTATDYSSFQHSNEATEIEFYELLWRYPRLRNLEIAATYLVIINSLVSKIAHFDQVACNRSLNSGEFDAKQNIEASLIQVRAVFAEALESCIRRS